MGRRLRWRRRPSRSPAHSWAASAGCRPPRKRSPTSGTTRLSTTRRPPPSSSASRTGRPATSGRLDGGPRRPPRPAALAHPRPPLRRPVRRTRGGPLTLAGWVSWSTGDEPGARVALTMALRADPHYTFAQLLHRACNEGLDPETLRRCLRGEARAAGAVEEAGAAVETEWPGEAEVLTPSDEGEAAGVSAGVERPGRCGRRWGPRSLGRLRF
ncbi:DUF4192 family protein [Streptomyces sp. CBG31]|uniref:DUF4192 family protein n=1 Tax=Streptomyces sp. CBG31 TaxID=2762623 RepID=UPI0037DA2EBC